MNKIFNICLGLILLGSFSLSAHDHEGKEESRHLEHFKRMDTNNDKSLNKDEWQKFHDSHFKEMDKNSDGLVSSEEFKAFKDHRKSEKSETDEKQEHKKDMKATNKK